MQLNLETDYAIRCLMYMAAAHGDCVTSTELGEELDIEPNHVQKILRKLCRAGLLNSVRGRMGGYVMERPADTVTMKEILYIMEDSMLVNRCVAKEDSCSYCGECAVRPFFRWMQDTMDDLAASVSLEDLMKTHPPRILDEENDDVI